MILSCSTLGCGSWRQTDAGHTTYTCTTRSEDLIMWTRGKYLMKWCWSLIERATPSFPPRSTLAKKPLLCSPSSPKPRLHLKPCSWPAASLHWLWPVGLHHWRGIWSWSEHASADDRDDDDSPGGCGREGTPEQGKWTGGWSKYQRSKIWRSSDYFLFRAPGLYNV